MIDRIKEKRRASGVTLAGEDRQGKGEPNTKPRDVGRLPRTVFLMGGFVFGFFVIVRWQQCQLVHPWRA